uniref:Metal transporter putative n=1 Tax=Albugo laibachii Nc14 TaxID=890382 RepID=F0W5Y5_9STRA|nr:metal transporter putative [Albugo laibachii Nc14]|eukprot:CCA16526.1 metal transporter putative [Albugo laibachii Nc14]
MYAILKWMVPITWAFICISASVIVLEEISDTIYTLSAKANQSSYSKSKGDEDMLQVDYSHALAVDDPFIASKYNQSISNLSNKDWKTREAYLSAVIEVSRYIAIPPLIFVSAIFSGLTLGLLSLNVVGLKVLITSGNHPDATIVEQENAIAASRILSIRKNGHRLLTTLVLGNISTNSLLSILIADMTNGFIGFLLSTGVILLFGEIVPQAVCARHAISLGSKLVPLVEALLILFHPVAKSVQTALDRFIGEESGRIYTRKEFAKYLEIHAQQSVLTPQEIDLVRRIFNYKKVPVTKVMVQLKNAYTISISSFRFFFVYSFH